MRYEKKKITLKGGTECILQSPGEEDAAQMLAHFRKTAAETHFLARDAGEVTGTIEMQRQTLREALEKESRTTMIAAYIGEKPVGCIGVNRVSAHRKMRHRAMFGISVERDYWNMGIGTVLVEAATEMARAMDCVQLELGVYADNERARALYRRMGFEEWGVVRNAYRLEDGTYRDEIMMGKML